MSWLTRLFKTPPKRASDGDENIQPQTKKARVLFSQQETVASNPFDEDATTSFDLRDNVGLGTLLSSSLVPRPYTLVASLDKEGQLTIAPSSFCSLVSETPAFISIGLEKHAFSEDIPGSPASDIVKTKEFTVNIISEWMAEAATKTAGTYELPETEADLKTGLTTSASKKVSVPRVSEAAVSLECKLRHRYDIKDTEGKVASTVVIAEVVAISVNKGVLSEDTQGEATVDSKKLQPVAKLGGQQCGHISDVRELAVPVGQPAVPTTPPTAAEADPPIDAAEAAVSAVADALNDEHQAADVKEVKITLADDAATATETASFVIVVGNESP